jgi:hypothetical protein
MSRSKYTLVHALSIELVLYYIMRGKYLSERIFSKLLVVHRLYIVHVLFSRTITQLTQAYMYFAVKNNGQGEEITPFDNKMTIP